MARPRLMRLLAHGLATRLTLVIGPKGAGKTSLLSTWAAQLVTQDVSVAWLSIERTDDQLDAFLRRLALALNLTLALEDNLPTTNIIGLQEGIGPATSQAILNAMLRDLQASIKPVVVVIDDYDEITAPEIHQFVGSLIEFAPHSLRLILSSRTAPPVPVARLRAYGQLTEVRPADLNFTVGAEGAYQHKPPHFQRFMAQTAVLSQMSAALCAFVTSFSEKDCQSMLDALTEDNQLAVALDERRLWYRYDEYLHNYLRQLPIPGRETLHKLAAGWYAAHDMPYHALDHALQADPSSTTEGWARQVVAQLGWMRLSRRDRAWAGQLSAWLGALPDDARRGDSRLGLLHAWALIEEGRWDRLSMIEHRLRETLNSPQSGPYVALQEGIRTTIALLKGDTANAQALSQHAITEIDTLRGVAALNLGQAHRVRGDLRVASEAFKQAIILNRDNAHLAAVARCQLGYVQMAQGQLHEAARSFGLVLQDSAPDILPLVVGLSRAGLAALLYEWGELAESTFHANALLTAQETELRIAAHLALARLALAQHDDAEPRINEVLVLLQDRRALLPDSYFYQIRATVAELYTAIDLPVAARLMAGRMHIGETSTSGGVRPDLSLTTEMLVIARLRYAEGNPSAAVGILSPLCEALRLAGHVWALIDALLLLAMAKAEAAPQDAIAALGEALSHGYPQGFQRAFLDKPIADLLEMFAHHDEQKTATPHPKSPNEAVGRRLNTYALHLTELSRAIAPPALSEREVEVLRYIAVGHSNREIANVLVVTVETVKWHVKNIYRKLNVTTRTQAINRAKRLKLIS